MTPEDAAEEAGFTCRTIAGVSAESGSVPDLSRRRRKNAIRIRRLDWKKVLEPLVPADGSGKGKIIKGGMMMDL